MRLKTRMGGVTATCCLVVSLIGGIQSARCQEIAEDEFRSDVEARIAQLESTFKERKDVDSRRALVYATFQLGQFWRAAELIEPLIATETAPASDVKLAARLSFLLGQYDQAEELFKRLKKMSEDGSPDSIKATEGLIMVAYQTNRFAAVKDFSLPPRESESDDSKENRLQPMLTFMQKFEGEPYQIQWENDTKIAHIPIMNKFHQLGALPEFDIQVNGRIVHLILDTGGDRLYLDEGVAKEIGIRTIAKRTSKYAYTGGKTVEEPLGVADNVQLGDVTLSNVPVIVAKWKAMGQKTDGILTTQILKQFLSTIDYANKRITLRPRGQTSVDEVLKLLGDKPPISMPFVMSATHLMFVKGGINDRDDLNLFVDSGLAASMPMVVANETAHDLGLDNQKVPVEGTKYYWVPISKLRMGALEIGATQALGNIFVETDNYRSQGFFFDALVSHQFLKQFGSWTIDFDARQYYFPAK